MKKLALAALLCLGAAASFGASDQTSATVNVQVVVAPFVTISAPSTIQVVTTSGAAIADGVNGGHVGSNYDVTIQSNNTFSVSLEKYLLGATYVFLDGFLDTGNAATAGTTGQIHAEADSTWTDTVGTYNQGYVVITVTQG